jgi:transcriptional regulator with XRE-family HTH domain
LEISTRRKTGSQTSGRPHGGTRLVEWLEANGFTSAQLEKKTKITRQSVGQIRRVRDVRRSTMIRVLRACRALAHRKVGMEEIFDLDPDSPVNAD